MGFPRAIVRIIQKGFKFRFILARLTHIPLLGKWIDHLLFRDDSIIYLPQNKVVLLNKKIGELENFDNMALPSRVVDHFV